MHAGVRCEVGIETRSEHAILPTPTMAKKLVVVGAGPVGCLVAIALANMGWVVEIYEARPGIPSPSTFPHSTLFTNS
jgi:NADPH-dependent 2,4-dienoyl-CoA reductase/sulfur reductase-like enzyme